MPQSSHYHRGRIHDPGLVYNVRRGLGPPPPDGGGHNRIQPKPHRGRGGSGSNYRSRSSDNNRIMSRSATTSHYASPTMASRSHQAPRSLTRSHEETMPPRSPSKNGLLRPPNSPSRNALAASITSISQQVRKSSQKSKECIFKEQLLVFISGLKKFWMFDIRISFCPADHCTLFNLRQFFSELIFRKFEF